MKKLWISVLCYMLALNYGEGFFGIPPFRFRNNICNFFCRLRNRFSDSNNETCLVFLNHNDVVTSPCVSNCLARKGESLVNTIKCECRDGKCIEPTTPTPVTTTTPTITTALSQNNNNPSQQQQSQSGQQSSQQTGQPSQQSQSGQQSQNGQQSSQQSQSGQQSQP